MRVTRSRFPSLKRQYSERENMNLCWSRNANTLRSTGHRRLQRPPDASVSAISNPPTIGGNPKAMRNGKSHPRLATGSAQSQEPPREHSLPSTTNPQLPPQPCQHLHRASENDHSMVGARKKTPYTGPAKRCSSRPQSRRRYRPRGQGSPPESLAILLTP